LRSERPVLPSLLDRLINYEPKLREDPPVGRNQSVMNFKASLQRDLEWLLNTRRISESHTKISEELGRSLYCYGMPEFSNVEIATAAQVLTGHIETAIRTFEPRLNKVKVTMPEAPTNERTAHFVVEAILLIDPVPERVVFDTVLELNKGEYRVRGDN
jgi:type VI secretion system protein ImpF